MSVKFRTITDEYVYPMEEILKVIKSIKTVDLNDAEDLSYTANSDLVVNSKLGL